MLLANSQYEGGMVKGLEGSGFRGQGRSRPYVSMHP